MIALKKVYRDELLQLAIILSLLRGDTELYRTYQDPVVGVDIHEGLSWAHALTPLPPRINLHPKSLDSMLLSYEREVFEDLNALGRYNRIRAPDVTAYLLNVDGISNVSSAVEAEDTSGMGDWAIPGPSGMSMPLSSSDELTQEDMDLIEVLWKQDVDLGFSLDLFNTAKEEPKNRAIEEEDAEKLKALRALKNDTNLGSTKVEEDDDLTGESEIDPWAGIPYTVDLETGEYVLKTEESLSDLTTDEQPSAHVNLPEFSLEEALQFVGLDEDSTEAESSCEEEPVTKEEPKEEEPLPNSEEELGVLGDMIQTAQFHHPRPYPGRMPLVRTMSMEQRWQDLANLLSLPSPGDPHHPHHPHHHHHAAAMGHHPFSHHHHGHHHNYSGGGGGAYPPDSSRGVLLHNATLAPPMGDINATSPYTMSGGASNLGSAVATSMNLTNSSEPMGDSGPSGAYKMEGGPHDMMYYQQNSTPEINQTTEGFLSSILNEEDLQLMDMAMNEGMYTMRMLDGNSSNNGSAGGGPVEERLDASSDSAVSSMGSERVPSLSDGEWMETGSDSGHHASDHYAMDYHPSKFRAYDYSGGYHGRQHGPTTPETSHRMPPMAQKKHQMFGKRYFQDQSSGGASLGGHNATSGLPPAAPVKFEFAETSPAFGGGPVEGAVGPKPPELKYSCSMDFARHHPEPRASLEDVAHNHSYHLPPETGGVMQRPPTRDKVRGRRTTEEEHLNRDEKRARGMNIPMSVADIINLPMDEFNERLSKYDLSESQLSLIRDIRRRGKNKVAAQNCRKRKLDQILSLADEVKDMRDRKLRLVRERDYLLTERQRTKDKFSQLYRHIFQALRDPDGNQYSPYEYSLQQSADGSVLLVPRTNSSMLDQDSSSRIKHKDHDHLRKE